jgi:PPM family protein phosphatase
MRYESWCQTDVGVKRESNQDSYLLRPDLGLYVVADGMGGHKGGEVASAIAVDTIGEVIRKARNGGGGFDPRQALTNAYRESSFQIYQKGQVEKGLRGMATTMISILLHDDVCYIGNVGDSRAYLFSAPGVWQFSEDHSLFNENLKAGLVREEDRNNFEGKNIITRSVGFESESQCDIFEYKLRPGEALLLCSDGLSNMVSDPDLAGILFSSQPQEVVQRLIDEAKRNGGDDNITVLVLLARP